MPKQVADKYYLTHTIAPGVPPVQWNPLDSLADNQCLTYGQLIEVKNYGYPIEIKSAFSGDPIIDSNGHINTPVTNYTSNRLVSKEDITISAKVRRVDIEIVIQPQAAGGVVGYAAAGGKRVYFNNRIYWMAVDKADGDTRIPLCTLQLGQISVAIKGTGNIANVQNTSYVFPSGEYDGYLNLHLNNPYAVSFPFAVTSKSDITIANVLTISPTSFLTETHQYFYTVRVDYN